jgi:hypothetical protein
MRMSNWLVHELNDRDATLLEEALGAAAAAPA